MNKARFLKFALRAWFSRPAHQRVVYRMIRQLKATSIVEMGIQDGLGTRRIIETACCFSPTEEVRYTGIDLFEARPENSPGWRLKDAHRELNRYGVHVKLIPGDPFSALARSANVLTGTDLVIIRGDQDAESLQQSWFYLPRMLHERSVVLQESNSTMITVPHASIEQWANRSAMSRRAA